MRFILLLCSSGAAADIPFCRLKGSQEGNLPGSSRHLQQPRELLSAYCVADAPGMDFCVGTGPFMNILQVLAACYPWKSALHSRSSCVCLQRHVWDPSADCERYAGQEWGWTLLCTARELNAKDAALAGDASDLAWAPDDNTPLDLISRQ